MENQIKTDKDKEYCAISPGDINAETSYALAAFCINPPKIKEDVSLTVEQAMDKLPLADLSIKRDASIREFIDLIIKKDLKTAPVLNEDNTLAGIVSRKSLAAFMLHDADHLSELKNYNITYENIAKLIDAQVLTGRLTLQDTLKGDVKEGAYSDEMMKKFNLQDAIVIVGDRKNIQLTAIQNGAKALIITKDSPIDLDIIQLAKEKM